MRVARQALVIVLCFATLAGAQGNTWNKVRYNGGTLQSKVSPKDWDNKLTISSDLILFQLKDGQKLEISPKSVTSLSYGQEAHRRVGTMIALGILVAPAALFGLFHKTKLHFIGIQYTTPDGKKAGLLLQGHKDNYRALLVALQSVSGVPVAVGEKERGNLPVGIITAASGGPEETQAAAGKIAPPATDVGTVAVTTMPAGADIYADGAFVGNSPATLKLAAGKHTVRAVMSGFKDWAREITIEAGSEVQLTARLEK